MGTPQVETADRVETILIVEDEPTERMLARVYLERAGYRVLDARDGPEGLDIARKEKPDLIILDIHLPTISGFALCRQIRADSSLFKTPVLISTGRDDTDSVAEGFDAGASDFLTKPTIWPLLSYRIKFLLRTAKVERELADANRLAHATSIALAENERHYRDLFDHAPVMMHRIDEQFHIQNVNQNWLENTGYTKDEVIGHDFIEFVDDDTRKRVTSDTRAKFVEIGKLQDVPCRIRRKDGTLIEALQSSTAEYSANRTFVGAHTVLLDVTERFRAERQLRHAHQAAESASRAKSVFLATMSHEIRTPLNGVIGMIDLLEQTELDTDQASMIRTVRDSAYSLLNIIGDILDFSKIEAGELSIEYIDISVTNVVEGVVETLLPLAREKNIELNVFTSPTIPDLVSGDPVRIRQILFNLVGNAIKFSENKDGRPAEVSIRSELSLSEASSQPVIQLRVSDTGMGISEDHLARLFTPFFQAEDSTVRRFGGTGLGLSICKNLVDLMGGSITVSSQPGEGSTFSVELPLKPAKGTAGEVVQQLRGQRILLASADPSVRRTIETYLSHEGAHVVLADSVSKAQTLMETAADINQYFDVAIIAHSQPQTVDIENRNISELQKIESSRKTGFIVLSADRRNRTQGVLPNAVLIAKRPLSRSALLRAVLSVSGNRQTALPSAKNAAAKIKRVPEGTELAGGLILIAEDNTINQLVIQRQLKQFGYIADIAADGAEGLEAFQKGNYKLLLTDCHMPKMDGFELTAAIRRLEKGTDRRVPIVAITANALQGEAGRCLAAGMDDFLTKPVDLEKLGETLEKWLGRQLAGTGAAADQTVDRAVVAAGPETAADDTDPTTEQQGRQAMAEENPDDPNAQDANPIDLAMLGRLLGTDDEEYLKEMIAIYWETMRETAVDLSNHLNARNAPNLRDAAHAAKGASASVGAVPVASLLEKLQFAARDANWEQIEGLMPKIETAFVKLEQYIETLRAA